MTKIYEIDNYRPNLVLVDSKNNPHVIPVSVFIDIAKGRKQITDIDDYQEIVRVVVFEWLYKIGIEECMIK